jgi:hypothetical protein
MRKGFNFYRSYYDVFKELPKKDKLDFIEALLDRQFTGIEPSLTGIANFAYLSQKHSIDSQIKGFEDKTGVKLTPCQGGSKEGYKDPSQQEKVKEKEKVQDVNTRKARFYESLTEYIGQYKKETLRDFFEYWSEHGKNDKKMRFEKEKSFSISRRLKRWTKNDFNKTENSEEEKGKGLGGFSMMEMYENGNN